MSRRRKNSAPPSHFSELEEPGLPYWERTAGFRESLLQLFPRKQAKALRRLGHLLFYLVTETDLPDDDDPDHPSLTRREVEAAMVDLRHTQSFLAGISRQVEDSDLKRADIRLASEPLPDPAIDLFLAPADPPPRELTLPRELSRRHQPIDGRPTQAGPAQHLFAS